jgi:hypothetical protein
MKREKAFAIRLAFFNAIGFFASTAIVTFADARLVNGFRFQGGRQYPLGYWVCLVSVAIFYAVYQAVIRSKPGLLRLLAPSFVVIACTVAVLPNFEPLPHGFVTPWMFLYCATTVGTLWVRYFPEDHSCLSDEEMDSRAKIEWIKESILLWRTLLTGLAIAYVGLIATWFGTAARMSETITADGAELELIGLCNLTAIAIYSAFVVGGPLYELFVRMQSAADLFLRLKRKPVKRSVAAK